MANNPNLSEDGKNTQFSESGKKAASNGKKGGIQLGINNKARKEEAKQLAMTKEAIAAALEILLTKAKKKAKTQEQLDKIEQLEAINNPIVSLILDIAFNTETKDKDKLKAADMILDRLEGKPQGSTEDSKVIKETIYIEREETEAYKKHIDEVINNGKDK